ncbi:unnamed protein product [Caretta caretta]
MWAEGPCRTPPRPPDAPRLVAAHHLESCQALQPACGSPRAELAAPAPRPCAPRLEEFARRSTLHGIRHVFAHGPYTGRHLLWTLAFLGSLGLLLHVYAERLGYYLQHPHNTQLEEETGPSTPFPAVTLCNLNRARFSQLTRHDLHWAGELLGLLDAAHRPLAPEALAWLPGELALSPEEQRRPFDLRELYGRAGHQLDLGQMLLGCKFANQTCNAGDFQTVSAWRPRSRGHRRAWGAADVGAGLLARGGMSAAELSRELAARPC